MAVPVISGIFLLIIVIIGWAIYMKKVLSSDLTSATSHLDKLSEGNMQKEEALRKQLEEAKRQSQEIIANAQKDALQQKEALLKQVQEEKEKIVSEAHQSAEEVIKQADNARLALLAETDRHINERALLKAVELLQVSIPEEIKLSIHGQWTDNLIRASFENLDRLKLPEGLSEVGVVGAFPLTPEQKSALSDKLTEKLGLSLRVAEQVDPQLVAGIVVTLGSLCMDGSLRFKIQEVARGQR